MHMKKSKCANLIQEEEEDKKSNRKDELFAKYDLQECTVKLMRLPVSSGRGRKGKIGLGVACGHWRAGLSSNRMRDKNYRTHPECAPWTTVCEFCWRKFKNSVGLTSHLTQSDCGIHNEI